MNEALRLVAWLTAGGGGGIVGGVDLGWVFTSAGESGIVPTFCTLLLGEGRGQTEVIVAVIIHTGEFVKTGSQTVSKRIFGQIKPFI